MAKIIQHKKLFKSELIFLNCWHTMYGQKVVGLLIDHPCVFGISEYHSCLLNVKILAVVL